MSLEDTVIRRADECDYEAACALYQAVDNFHVRMYPSIFQETDGPSRPREHFVEKLTNLEKAVFVAERNGELCGLVDAQIEATPPYPMFVPSRIARIDNLVVPESYRRQGIARALLAAIRQWTEERGIQSIQLSVYSKNTDALACYEDAGFEPLLVKLELKL
jgi:ribosomal protein S18 acetylase RimI-like enzyme